MRALLSTIITFAHVGLLAGILQATANAAPNPNAAPAYAQPAEFLVLIMADVHRHLNDDVYRFPYPTDVLGQNIFRAALVRLANYEKLYPGKMSDVVALTKAQAWERLCAFREAGTYYEEARKSADDGIRTPAGEGFERCKRLSLHADSEIDQSGLRTTERDLKKRIAGLSELAADLKSTPYACLALIERERAQMQLAEFYVVARFIQPYTTKDAETEMKRNAEANRDSKKRYAHHLRLADFYYDRAQEYALKNAPDGTSFNSQDFEGFVNPARSEYKIVEEADGFPEKLEARAKLIALEAFVDRVGEQSR